MLICKTKEKPGLAYFDIQHCYYSTLKLDSKINVQFASGTTSIVMKQKEKQAKTKKVDTPDLLCHPVVLMVS